jgi:hypothetical protein
VAIIANAGIIAAGKNQLSLAVWHNRPSHMGLTISALEAKPVCDGGQKRDPQSEP